MYINGNAPFWKVWFVEALGCCYDQGRKGRIQLWKERLEKVGYLPVKLVNS